MGAIRGRQVYAFSDIELPKSRGGNRDAEPEPEQRILLGAGTGAGAAETSWLQPQSESRWSEREPSKKKKKQNKTKQNKTKKKHGGRVSKNLKQNYLTDHWHILFSVVWCDEIWKRIFTSQKRFNKSSHRWHEPNTEKVVHVIYGTAYKKATWVMTWITYVKHAGLGAGAADTFYYNILLTKCFIKIFCDIRSLSYKHFPTIFFRTIILFSIFCLRYFVSYDLYPKISYLMYFSIGSFALRSFSYDLLSCDLLRRANCDLNLKIC